MMSDLNPVEEEYPSAVDIEERGNSLRVASNTPHLISLGCGRLSTAVTIHPLKQGGVILGSDNSCGIHLQGTGVQPIHCKIENSNGVVTLYPLTGVTTLDGDKVEEPTRLSQGCTVGVGRSTYLRFNHPAEANLMKSVLPDTGISMAPIQFLRNDSNGSNASGQCDEPDKYERLKNALSSPAYNNNVGQEALKNELEMIGDNNVRRKKPPVAPRRMFRDLDQTSNSSSSDQETVGSQQNNDYTPKTGSIMSKVSKFEFYLKNSQRTTHKSSNPSNGENWSPKVFSSNAATGNIAAKDLIGKNVPTNYVNKPIQQQAVEKSHENSQNMQRIIVLNENKAVEAKNCSYSNVMIKSQVQKIDQISKTFESTPSNPSNGQNPNRPNFRIQTPSPSFNRNPVFNSPLQSNFKFEQNGDILSNAEERSESLNDENQKFLEQARINEILSMCAEYEKQNSNAVPTTPTEKKTHNKIITNGSLPRGYQNNPNIVPTSDGYYRFDTGRHKIASSPRQINSPLPSFNELRSPGEGVVPNGFMASNPSSPYQQMTPINSPVLSKSEIFPQNTRQFPITELSSPLMIRKVARNAQNSANYIANYEQSGNFNPNNGTNGNLRNGVSPYENVALHNQNILVSPNSPPNAYIPKSPNTNSPRTRIKTTYASRNVPQPQHFVFPSPPRSFSDNGSHTKNSPGIEKQLSLTEDIPMIDDTEFANELEMRISKLKPENREKILDKQEDFVLDPLQNINGIARRNFEEIRRDLIADIPELDAIQEDLDRNIAGTSKTNKTDAEKLSANYQNLVQELNYESQLFKNENGTNIHPQDVQQNKQIDENKSVVEKRVLENEISNQHEIIETFLKNEAISTEHVLPSIVNVNHVNSNDEKKAESSIDNDKKIESQFDEENNAHIKKLEHLYHQRKAIMNHMKELKTEINDLEVSRKQSQLELDEFEERIEKVQDGLQVQKDFRKDEIEMVAVSDSEKFNFKSSQEDRQREMREMQKKLELADEHVKDLEKQFSKGRATLEELRHAQEQLENEKKVYEDMEFQHLEKESEFYSRIAKEQNVLKNDPWGTCKKIEKLENLLEELHHEMTSYERQINEKNDNPHIRKLLNKLSALEKELGSVNDEINLIKRECGIYRKTDKAFNIENYKARIKSGDFSPPTSDDDDMNEIKDRIKSSDDQNSDHRLQSNPDNLKDDSDPLLELENVETNCGSRNEKKNPSIDPMSMSMIIETKTSLHEICDDSSPLDNSSTSQTIHTPETPDGEKEKKGFWERNFDSLTRLKNKDKKNKNIDIMSQSLNENMFYNNEHIESEFGSFEKCNTGKSNTNCKSKDKVKSDEPHKSKLASFPSLSKIMRRDSLGKKNKEKPAANDKENVDVSRESPEKSDDSGSKNMKHRYLKNSKTSSSDNKYVIKSKVNSNSAENKDKDTGESVENSIPIIDAKNKIFYRKSAGDEIKKTYLSPDDNLIQNTKIPSQDDIDRISKITLDAPLFSSNGDMNTLGRKTLDSLRELERNRVAMLEQNGCEVIENEREKMTELKKRVQNETLLKWEEDQLKTAKNEANLIADEIYIKSSDYNRDNSLDYKDTSIGIDIDDSCIRDDSALDSTSFEKQLRNSQSDSYNSSAYIEDDRSGSRNERQGSPLANVGNNGARPLSEMSDMSSDNGVSPQPLMEGPRRSRKISSNSLNNSFIRNRDDSQRPLTRYLPIDKEDLNLRHHIESAGHQVDLCPHVTIDFTSCRGYLHKLGAKFHGWSKRWFVFDRSLRALVYYSDKSEKKPRGGAYFQVIEEVYLDHLNASKSPSPLTTFVVKTRQRRYYLMAPSGPAARIWIDVIFTGAQGYTEYLQ